MMKDYTKLIEALRHCNGPSFLTCRECQYNNNMVSCAYKMMRDAAAAIEALNHLVDLNTERCEGLRKQLREAQEQYEKNINELEKELSFSESTYDEFQIVAATQNALLAKKLTKRGEWVHVRKVDIPGEMHPVAFKCMCANCRNEYVFPRMPQYCPDCGSRNTAKMEAQDGQE